MWTTGEGGKEGACSRGGRSELERRLPRDLRVRAGRMFVEDARCLLDGGGARLAMLCAGSVEEERERAGREEVDQVRRGERECGSFGGAAGAHWGCLNPSQLSRQTCSVSSFSLPSDGL